MPLVAPPACSEQVESWLTARGVKFKPCRRIPLDKIKHEESRRNQARQDALLPDVVERYTAAVKAGEQFPPVVVFKSGQGYVIIDGNHRDEAHVKARAENIVAYEVSDDTPSELIELLTVEANTRHGQPTDTAWRIQQALHLLATGHEPESVYVATGVTSSQVSTAKRLAKADERARRVGVYNWETIPATSRALLASLNSDPVLASAAAVVIDTSMTGDDVKAFMRQLRDAASEADALRIVGEAGDQRKTRMGAAARDRKRRLSNPRTRVLAALGQITSLTPGELPRLFTTEADRKEVASRCADAAMVLMTMEEVLRDALQS